MKKKLTNFMRANFACMLFFVCFNLSAQSTKTIDLKLNKVSVKEFLTAIESKTDYRFIYDGVDISTISQNVTVDYKKATVQSILEKELPKSNIKYQIKGNQIVLTKSATTTSKQGEISGVVVDDSGIPVIGATITLKGTTVGTFTDMDGRYKLTIPAGTTNPTLEISFLGYTSIEEAVGSRSKIDVKLVEDTKVLSEVVVVGYGSVKKSDATGALEVIKSSDFNKGTVSSPEMLLNGHVAGVQITPGSGQPGANTSVRIRGVNSISASSEPLYVIDGVPVENSRQAVGYGNDAALSSMPINPLSMIAPADIESMTVLKDASATAIYGSRGANGVIIITTKGGKNGVKSINYSSTLGISSVSKKLDVLNAEEYRSAVLKQDPTAVVNKDVSTDWQDEIFRTVVTQDHNITFSNGTENTSYRASLSMSDQPGIIISTGMKRYSLRVNAVHKMFDNRLILSVNANNTRYEMQNFLEQQTSGASGGVINNALKGRPDQPVYNKDGSFNEYSEQEFRNPVAMAKQISDKSVGDRFIGNAEAEFFFIPKELSLKANMGYDVDNSSRKAYQPRTSVIARGDQGRALIENNRYASFLTETYATYNKTFADRHSVNLIGGYSFQEFESYLVSTRGTGFVSDVLGADNMAGAKSIITENNKEVNRLISFYARFIYGLDNKYMFTGTLRRDGSSRFGANNRWGIFPSGAFAWKVKEEAFMKSVDFVSDLKFRLGYGVTGNQDIGNFRYGQVFDVNSQFGTMWNQQLVTAYNVMGIPNPDLKWEQTTQFNVGIDYSFLNNRIRGSLDFYNKKTTDLLLEVDAVQPAVVDKYLDNIGEMSNKGIEFTISGVLVDNKDFGWNTNFNIAYNKNEITKLNYDRDIFHGIVSGKGAGEYPLVLRVGEPFGTFYGKKFSRFEEGTAVDENGKTVKTYKEVFEPGGDQVLGHAMPEVTLGFTNSFNYKDFDLSIVFRSALGGKIFNNTRAELEKGRLPNKNTTNEGADYYLKGGRDVEYRSSRWIEDASFLRLDNMTLGYNFKIFPKVVKSARAYVTAQNLFVITKYSGYDPEVSNQSRTGGVNSVGIDYCSYPHSRTFLFGLNLNF